jgi:hypothetical protein
VIRLLGLLSAVLAFVVAGCGTSPPATTSDQAVPVAAPTSVEIDRIAANSSLIPLSKQANGEIEVPDVHTPMQAGWYSLGVKPGAPGPAVIVGHVDGGGQPGIFKRLHELQTGDRVKVAREDGSVATFEAYDVAQAQKNAFPTARVYGNTAGPELRLVTCGGQFVGGDLGYQDNIIVFLRMVQPGT